MKLENIKEGKIYILKHIDSWNKFHDGEKIIIKKVINEEKIIVDFIEYKRPVLVDATEGKIEYIPLLNMVISAEEVRRLKN